MMPTDRTRNLTIAAVIWIGLVLTWVIWRVFGDSPPEITGGTATAFGALLGLPPAIFAFYQWARKDRD
jgi:hypothetical protein